MTTDARGHYNKTAGIYDMRHASPSTQWLRRMESRAIKRHCSGRVLDLGCGTGYHLKRDYFGLDVSEGMLRVAGSKTRRLILGDTAALPVRSGSFGTVLCMFSTLNMCDIEAAAREMARVLRPSGKAIISVSSIFDMEHKGFFSKILQARPETLGKKFRISGSRIRITLYSREYTERIFQSAGLRKIAFDSCFIFQNPRWGNWNRFSILEKARLYAERALLFKDLGIFHLFVFQKPGTFQKPSQRARQ